MYKINKILFDLLIFVVAVISLLFRRNWIHIILFVFLIVPFIPYINSLFKISDKQSLHNLLSKSNTLPFLISLILLPVYLMWFRILNSIKKHYPKKRIYAAAIGIAYCFILIFLCIINKVAYSDKKTQKNIISPVDLEDSSVYNFDFSY